MARKAVRDGRKMLVTAMPDLWDATAGIRLNVDMSTKLGPGYEV